jgi:Holliday junction resolvase-like predicted endonuclease
MRLAETNFLTHYGEIEVGDKSDDAMSVKEVKTRINQKLEHGAQQIPARKAHRLHTTVLST